MRSVMTRVLPVPAPGHDQQRPFAVAHRGALLFVQSAARFRRVRRRRIVLKQLRHEAHILAEMTRGRTAAPGI